jgi:hypothetical protein
MDTVGYELTADSIGHDDKAGVSRLSGLRWLNSWSKRWPQDDSVRNGGALPLPFNRIVEFQNVFLFKFCKIL